MTLKGMKWVALMEYIVIYTKPYTSFVVTNFIIYLYAKVKKLIATFHLYPNKYLGYTLRM